MAIDDDYPYFTTNGAGLPQFDNEFQVAKAALVGRYPHTSQSPHTDIVVVIATKDGPDSSPFHFRFEEARLREFVKSASEYFDSDL